MNNYNREPKCNDTYKLFNYVNTFFIFLKNNNINKDIFTTVTTKYADTDKQVINLIIFMIKFNFCVPSPFNQNSIKFLKLKYKNLKIM